MDTLGGPRRGGCDGMPALSVCQSFVAGVNVVLRSAHGEARLTAGSPRSLTDLKSG